MAVRLPRGAGGSVGPGSGLGSVAGSGVPGPENARRLAPPACLSAPEPAHRGPPARPAPPARRPAWVGGVSRSPSRPPPPPRAQVEWDILASWVVANHLWSNNVVWLIQIPRLYNVYRDQVTPHVMWQRPKHGCRAREGCVCRAVPCRRLPCCDVPCRGVPCRAVAWCAPHHAVLGGVRGAPCRASSTTLSRCWRTSSARSLRPPPTRPATRSCTCSWARWWPLTW